MDHTELIKPNDPMSSSPCGVTKILLGRLAPRTQFQVKEWKRIATGATVMLTRPSVLCVCDMWAFEQRPYLHGIFHVVDSTHGAGNLAITVHNLRKKAVKTHRMTIRSPTFCAFALALDTIDTMPLQLTRVPARKRDERKIATAKVTTASTRSGQKILRLAVTRLKWQPHTPNTKSALASATLENIDMRKIAGFDVKTVSDPNTAVAEAEIQKGTKTVILRLSHHANHGQAPDALVMLLVVMTKKANVTMKRGTDNVLQKLPSNGFRVQPQRPLRAGKGDEMSIATDATYVSDKYVAFFLPYLIAGLNLSVSVWLPGTQLDIRLAATEDVNLPPNTPIGEIRFVSSASVRVNTDRHSVLTAPQNQVTARGPGEFKVIPHGINTVQGGNALMGTPEPEDEEDDGTSNDPTFPENEMEAATVAAMIEDQDMMDPSHRNEEDEEDDGIYYDDEDEDEDEEDDDSVDEDSEEDSYEEEAMAEEEPAVASDSPGNDPDPEQSSRLESRTQSAMGTTESEELDRTAVIPESPIREHRDAYRRYISEDYSPSRRRYPPADIQTWNVARRVKKIGQDYLREKHEDDYAFELMIRLHPLNAKILPSALAPLIFAIPRQAFDPKTDPFYFTFLSREREVLMFNTLMGREVASSRDERPRRATQKVLRV